RDEALCKPRHAGSSWQMPEEWFVRVQDKDYGPVDLDTLQEWKAEGRLIPANEVRQSGTDAWLPAAQYPELFGVEPPPLPRQQQGLFRRRSFSEIISDSVRIWARGFLQFFLLALFVAIHSILSFLIAVLALTFQVYMAGRLFVNFMFWQQSCTIAGLDAAESLRESKDLARGRNNEPWHQRPLWRGAIIASIWLVVLVAVSVAVETPFTLVRLHGIKT